MSAEVLKAESEKHGIVYKTKDPAKLALLEWVCAHYGISLPRLWLTKELVKIKYYPEEFEAAAMAAAAAEVAPRRELGAGLALSVALADRMAPYDTSRVRPARVPRRGRRVGDGGRRVDDGGGQRR